MHTILIILWLLFLVSCSNSMNSGVSDTSYLNITKESFDCPKDSTPIFGENKNTIGCSPLLRIESISDSWSISSWTVDKTSFCNSEGELVSWEICYTKPILNTIGLSDIDAKWISMQLFRKREDRIYFKEGYKYLTWMTVGGWKVKYNQPNYPNWLDSINVTSGTKNYTFTWIVYTKEDRDVYLWMIKQGYCRLEGQELEQYKKENSFIIINDIYYKSPNTDCSMRKSFAYFTSISPDGRYVTYDVWWYEFLSTMILDVLTWKTYFITEWSSIYKNSENLSMVTNASNVIWNRESTRFTYTTPWFYCLAEKNGNIFSDIRCQKSSSYDILTMIYEAGIYYGFDILDYRMTKLQLRGFDGDTFEEVYIRNIEATGY